VATPATAVLRHSMREGRRLPNRAPSSRPQRTGRMKPSESTPTWRVAHTVRSSLRSRVFLLPAGGMHQSARQQLAHFVALELSGLLRGVAERHRSKPAGSPAQPAFPRLSTATIYIGGSGRRSWLFGYRGSAAVRPGRSLAVLLVHRRTDGPEERASAVGSCRVVPERSSAVTRLAFPRAVAPVRTTRAKPMPPHLTPACSGLATLAADAGG
jgi:hypothetical protein